MVIGIDKSTPILVRAYQVEVVSNPQVLVFRNSDKSRFDYDAKPGAFNLGGDISLHGNKFTIN